MLLSPDEPPAFEVIRPGSASLAFLVCDHASNRIPRKLGDLGLTPEAREDHIAWDVGAAAVARHVSGALGATLVLAGYSRLVLDVNRRLDVPSSIPEATGGIAVPGNQGLSPGEARERQDALFFPYHAAIARELDARSADASNTFFLSIHSFTPSYPGQVRPWHVSVLHGGDNGPLAKRWIAALAGEAGLIVGDNEPYRPDGSDHTFPAHAEARRLPSVLLEIRQDGLRTPSGIAAWGDRVVRAFHEVHGA